ncbi:adenosylcobinamide-GDP ribazoletransferase [Pseudoruegeria sp. SHC-113]|uniref:adenosylcobinamide-GDP ribazoletransferase n=1 Tax=Pseudoruegeria sp. SHC-113 TaxID=2855439 RepID=UPI0021BB9C58|nr:adenosylcobinamide-GDP ribazoletransferase [Pseudoruegeria sp. SHC-113]MCT8159833.1 adenosylcobinamide-GDP ribazoletransferase [Pseudoruegeria sp. SHC-113]
MPFRPALSDIPAAIGLLTRLPVPVDAERAQARGAAGAWAYPVAGLLVGAITGLTALAAGCLGLPPALAAALALCVQIATTGALHEDGLADVADGFWGGWDKARRLEIMKDSRIGTYGVLALVASFALRWCALASLCTLGNPFWVLLALGALTRVPMVLLMAAMTNARGSGLAASVGRPPAQAAWLALGCGVLAALAFVGIGASIALLVWGGLACAGLAAVAKTKIGGQTGDVLGACQQVAEITGLMVLVALLD